MSTIKTQISLGIYIIHCLDNKISIDGISKISRLFSSFCSCAGCFRPYLVTHLWSQVFSWSGSENNVRSRNKRSPPPPPQEGLSPDIRAQWTFQSCSLDRSTSNVRGAWFVVLIIIWASTRQNQQIDPCAKWRFRSAWTATQSDQHHCPHEETLGLSFPLSAQRRLWSDCTNAHADLRLR